MPPYSHGALRRRLNVRVVVGSDENPWAASKLLVVLGVRDVRSCPCLGGHYFALRQVVKNAMDVVEKAYVGA